MAIILVMEGGSMTVTAPLTDSSGARANAFPYIVSIKDVFLSFLLLSPLVPYYVSLSIQAIRSASIRVCVRSYSHLS